MALKYFPPADAEFAEGTTFFFRLKASFNYKAICLKVSSDFYMWSYNRNSRNGGYGSQCGKGSADDVCFGCQTLDK